jgi:hypothetical protein
LAAAPALLTLVNRPVMAAPCKLASSHLSASLSRPGSGLFQCGGKKPTTWAAETNDANWPAAAQPGTLFNAVFGASPAYGNKTLRQMVSTDSDGTPARNLARHLVAAYLNAMPPIATPLEVLSVATIKTIWQKAGPSGGFYEPTAGIRWFADNSVTPTNPQGGLITWLLTTMPN